MERIHKSSIHPAVGRYSSSGWNGAPRVSSGFTLIELLVVVTIIAILAALTLQTAGYIQKKAASSRAEAEVAAISLALESYKIDYGDYPESGNSNSAVLIQALGVVINTNLNSMNKVYLDLPKKSYSPTNNPTRIVDPFGTEYGYEYPGQTNRSGSNFFDLWSTSGGSTNSTDQVQWIKNW